MKLEKIRTPLTGILLAVMISCGAAGCLLTAFDLNLESRTGLWLVCAATALICGIAFPWKWGGTAVLCLMALWAGYLWQRGEAGRQILQLVYRISHSYDLAYDCGELKLLDTAWNAGYADIPLQLTGCMVAAAVCRGVCRGRRTWPAVACALLPLIPCLVVTNTVPDAWCLFALLLGVVLLLLTASVRRLDTQQGARLLWLLALPVAAAMLLTFWMIPRESYVNRAAETRERILTWVESLPEKVEDAAREMASAVPGSSGETVDLKTLGRRSTLSYPVMEVTSDWGGTLYLRERDYDSYTGTGWTASPHRSETFAVSGEPAGSVQIRTRSNRNDCFLPYYPGDGVNLVGGSLNNTERERAYTLERQVLPDNWRALVRERAQGVWESEAEFTAALDAANYLDSTRYLLLPLETKERAKELLVTVLSGGGSATDRAETIAAYVRGSAEYDQDMERMPEGEPDFALWFLEDSDRGYCVHFATAAVVLLRAADIPARYVTGYLVRCSPGETVTVTADTAHAWAEYYEPQLACWIPLEATPAEGLDAATAPPEQDNQIAVRPSVPETRPEEPTVTPPSTGEARPQIPIPGQTAEPSSLSLAWLWAAAAVLAVILQRPVRIDLRRRRRGSTPNDRALGYWQEILLLSKLRRKAVPRELKELAQKAKFSQHTLTRDELAKMELYIDGSVDALKQRPWYLRLLYRYVFAAW